MRIANEHNANCQLHFNIFFAALSCRWHHQAYNCATIAISPAKSPFHQYVRQSTYSLLNATTPQASCFQRTALSKCCTHMCLFIYSSFTSFFPHSLFPTFLCNLLQSTILYVVFIYFQHFNVSLG